MKEFVCSICGVFGAAFASFFGGWSAGLTTLVIFMSIDYISGLIVAGVFHKSGKSENGGLESYAGWKGLIRKGMTLLIVLIGCRVDIMLNTNYIRDMCVIGFVTNEAISIIENCGLMGVPIPSVLIKAIDVLKEKSDSSDGT